MFFGHTGPVHIHVESTASNSESHVVYLFGAVAVASLVGILLGVITIKARKKS